MYNNYDDYNQDWNNGQNTSGQADPSAENTGDSGAAHDSRIYADVESYDTGKTNTQTGFESDMQYNSTYQPPKPAKKHSSSNKGLIIAACICCVFSLLLGAAGGALVSSKYTKDALAEQSAAMEELRSEQQSALDRLSSATGETTSSGSGSDIVYTSGSGMSVRDIAAKCEDSVVAINVDVIQTVEGFGYSQEYEGVSSGSGVIISEDGYIVTNNHVIEDGRSVTIIMRDGTEYPAEIVGSDDVLDIAVLKIEATGLVPAVIGTSGSVEIGETAVVIGNPLGKFGNSVTSGVVSGLDREITIDDETMILMQTDAAVNPGNSGGGLFNDRGELIGVIVAKSGGTNVEGLGFAIPIDDAKKVISDLMEYGYVTGRPQLGIEVVEIGNSMTAMRYGVNRLGLYIGNVENDSQAYNDGLRIGDCIVSIDGEEITTFATMKQILARHSVGDVLTIEVIRYGENKTETLNVTLVEKIPENFQTSKSAA